MSDRSYKHRLRQELEADEGDQRHGTLTGYTCGCRCERCCAAYAAYWAGLQGVDGDLKRGPWRTREVAVLAEMYGRKASAAELVQAFKRPIGAIRKEAQRLGIARRRPNARKGKRRRERMSINRVNITGNLTRDPELRETPGGTKILSFGVAVNDRRKNPQTGEWEDCPNFVDCVMFGSRAEAVSRYLQKGGKVAIEGKLRYSSWERDGQRRSKLEVIVDEIELMSRGQQQGGGAQAQRQQPPAADVYDEDIPF